jgi:B12-binding domain/radical SAM domain protein
VSEARPALILAAGRPRAAALAVLAGAVEAHPDTAGLDVHVAAPGEGLATAVRGASARGPVVVGWSFTSVGFPDAASALRDVRSAGAGASPATDGRVRAPRLVSDSPGTGRVLHVAGGPHPTADPAGTLRAGFDLVAEGEGERTLVDLLRRLARGEEAAGPGLAWLEAGAVRRGPPSEAVDLDGLPPFAPRLQRFGPIEITRGCAHSCRFCQTTHLHGGRVRHRSPARVAEAAGLLAARGFRDVRFVTPSALGYGSADGSPDLAAVEELLRRVRESAGPSGRLWFGTFPSEVRPEHVTAEAMGLLRRHVANDHLVLGAQSGSDRMLRACHRGHGAEDVRRAVRLVLEAGFRAKVDLIFGLPGEEPADAAATRGLAAEVAGLGAEVHAHAFLPLPGTPWAGATPGEIDPPTRALLEKLGGRGRASGPWRRQEGLARALPSRG